MIGGKLMHEQIIRMKSEQFTNHNQLEIVRRIMWHNEYRLHEYSHGHFSFLVKGESFKLEFKNNNEMIITSYLSHNSFREVYSIIGDTVDELIGHSD